MQGKLRQQWLIEYAAAKEKFVEDFAREILITLMDDYPSHDRDKKNTGFKI